MTGEQIREKNEHNVSVARVYVGWVGKFDRIKGLSRVTDFVSTHEVSFDSKPA